MRAAVAAAVLFTASVTLSGCAPAASAPRRLVGARASARESVAPVDPTVDHRTYLLLRLRERRLYMVTYDLEDAAPAAIESFPVAIGRKAYATPTGIFAVTDKVADPHYIQFDWNDPSRVIRTIPPGKDNPLGRRWIEFASGDGWQIGFHGTPHPELLGQAVSHGCVRMRNEDVVKVYDHVRVGTVVIVQP
jgi:lipoprotein-anchoring transpeptidase ErfK/SrfK